MFPGVPRLPLQRTDELYYTFRSVLNSIGAQRMEQDGGEAPPDILVAVWAAPRYTGSFW